MKNNKDNTKKSKSDYSSLDSELGTFNLEPPKHYREETKEPKEKNNKKKSTSKTSNQKRDDQKKKRKRSKLFYKVISIIAIVAAIIGVITTLSLTVFFKIDKINVVGNKIYTQAEVVEALPIKTGKNLFVANTDNAKQVLEKELPYVFNAQIKRKFPSTIVVTVTETPKVYYIKNTDKTFLILDQNLKVLESKASKKPKNGVEIKKATVKSAIQGKTVKLNGKKTNANLKSITSVIAKLKLDEITSITSVDVNTNYIEYKGRINIKLGSIEKLENKIYAALTAIEKLNESDPNATGEMVATNDKQIYFTDN